MSIEFRCVNCQATYAVSDDLAGKVVQCRECGVRSRVVAETEAPRRRPLVRATRADNVPESADVVVRLAEFVYQVVFFLAAVGATMCAILLLVGLFTRQVVEVLVGVTFAGLWLFFVVLWARFINHLTRVFVGAAKDVRAVKEKLCEEQAD